MRYVAFIVSLVALLALACKGGGGPASTSTAAPASPTPTATETPAAGAPAEVQAIVDAALSGDPQQLEPLVGYTKIDCTTSEGIGGPPLCREGEAAGTPVDVLSVGTCEGQYRRADEIDEMPLGLLSDLSLYAVYRWPQGSEPSADYALLLSTTAPARDLWGVAELLVRGSRFVHVKFGCGETAQQLAEFQGLEDVVLPPPSP